MAWIRMSDTAAMYPSLLGVAEHPQADERSVDEVFGWWTRLATLSAQHLTDYVVSYAVVMQVSGTRARADRLIAMAVFAGLLSEVELPGGRRGVKLLDDPEFVHLKTAEEVAWEKQRREDNGNPAITVLVRLRDGDACRYCGVVVRFTARRGKLAGTYDHRPPGQPADAERSVVSCAACNAARGNAPLEVADLTKPLLPAPEQPYYHRATRKWLNAYAALLAEHGLTPPSPVDDDVKDLRAGTSLQLPDTAPVEDVRPEAAQPVPAETGKSSQVASVRPTEEPGRDGTGRDGSGLDGSGREGSTSDLTSDPPTRSRRSRRGRRGGRTRRTDQQKP